MALFGFRIRNADRDKAADGARMRRLAGVLGELRAELEKEREGLRTRRERAAENAAFSMAALEDDGATHLSAKVDELAGSMSGYARRIASLEAQVNFVEGLLGSVSAFTGEYGIDIGEAAAPPRAASRP